MVRQKLSPIYRFSQLMSVENNSCWLWTGYTNKGYGRFNNGIKTVDAHRWGYQEIMQKNLGEKHLDHLCRNRSCVNPKHLDEVDNLENWKRGQSITRKKSKQTHCIHGHSFTKENTSRINGRRRCKECHKNKEAKYRNKNKQENKNAQCNTCGKSYWKWSDVAKYCSRKCYYDRTKK